MSEADFSNRFLSQQHLRCVGEQELECQPQFPLSKLWLTEEGGGGSRGRTGGSELQLVGTARGDGCVAGGLPRSWEGHLDALEAHLEQTGDDE